MSNKIQNSSKLADRRLRKACDRCHEQKLGCQRLESASKCVRCTRANKHCAWSISLRNRRHSVHERRASAQSAVTSARVTRESSLEAIPDACEEPSRHYPAAPTDNLEEAALAWSLPSSTGESLQDDLLVNPDTTFQLLNDLHDLPDLKPSTDSHPSSVSSSASFASSASLLPPISIPTPSLTDFTTCFDDDLSGTHGGVSEAFSHLPRSLKSAGESVQRPRSGPSTPIAPYADLPFSHAVPPLADSSSNAHWLLKIIDINIQLFNNHQTTSRLSTPSPLGSPSRLPDSMSKFDEAIRLSMRLFEILQQLNQSLLPNLHSNSLPNTHSTSSLPAIGDTPLPTAAPVDSGSLLIILSSYIRLLEVHAELLLLISYSLSIGPAPLQFPIITIGSSLLDPHPKLCIAVYLEMTDYLVSGLGTQVRSIIRGTRMGPAQNESRPGAWHPATDGRHPHTAVVEPSLWDVHHKEDSIGKLVADIRGRLARKRDWL